MKQEQKRRQTRKQQGRDIPLFAFTPASLDITREAMKVFEQSLQRATGQSAKRAFAKETMQSVNGKLDRMRQSVGSLCLITFDYNEKLVIATAIQQYRIEFLTTPLLTGEQQQKLKFCQQVERFALERKGILKTQDEGNMVSFAPKRQR